MGGRAKLLELLSCKDIDGDQVNFRVTVLSGLRGAHINDLARALLNNDVPVG